MFSNKSFTNKFSWAILSIQITVLALTFKSNLAKLPIGNLARFD